MSATSAKSWPWPPMPAATTPALWPSGSPPRWSRPCAWPCLTPCPTRRTRSPLTWRRDRGTCGSRGRAPAFVVPPPPGEPLAHADGPAAELPPVSPQDDDGAMARVNLRLSENLKGQIEEAAERAGLSVNGWLVRAASAALDDGRGRRTDRAARGSQRYTGWVR